MSEPALDDATIVWLAPAEGREDATRSLAEWARVRGVRLTVPTEGAARGLHVDLAVADRVEREVARGREAVAALDADGAERALARAEALLRDHPELPQAAWLRAEVDRVWASRWMRVEPRDESRARAAWQDADALDGGRAPGVGEVSAPRRAAVTASIVVHGASGREVSVRVDGLPAPAKGGAHPLEIAPAEHQVVTYVDDEPAFAQWITIASGTTIDVRLGDGGACDGASFAGVARDEQSVRAKGVTCERWVAAMALERRGAVLVARCEREVCGPLLEWRVEIGDTRSVPQAIAPQTRWPAWATWTLVGASAAAAGTVALIASGALEGRPSETRFVAGGVRIQSR